MLALLRSLFLDRATEPVTIPDSSGVEKLWIPIKKSTVTRATVPCSNVSWGGCLECCHTHECSHTHHEYSNSQPQSQHIQCNRCGHTNPAEGEEDVRISKGPKNGLEIVFENHASTGSVQPSVELTSKQEKAIRPAYILEKNKVEELGCLRLECKTLKEAAELSRQRGMPIFSVEYSVPGDLDAARSIFSHPHIVEIASCLFITAASTSFDQSMSTSGDNMCRVKVSILNSSLICILPSVEIIPSEYDLRISEVLNIMVGGLSASQRHVPTYLQLLRDEYDGLAGDNYSKAVFATYDCQLAEIHLADMHGILGTRTGRWRSNKVIQVTYNNNHISYSKLVDYCLDLDLACIVYYETEEEKAAATMEVAQHDGSRVGVNVFVGNIRVDSHAKASLRQSPLQFVPLTDLQATKCNRLVHMGCFNEAAHLLSPWQGKIMMHVLQRNASEKLFCSAVDVPIVYAWDGLCNS